MPTQLHISPPSLPACLQCHRLQSMPVCGFPPSLPITLFHDLAMARGQWLLSRCCLLNGTHKAAIAQAFTLSAKSLSCWLYRVSHTPLGALPSMVVGIVERVLLLNELLPAQLGTHTAAAATAAVAI